MKKIFFSIVILASGFATTICAQESKSEKNNSSLILTDWMQLHCHMVRNTKGIVHVAYSRHFSYTAIAVYQSIVGSNKNYRSLQGQLNGLKELPTSKGKLFWSASLNAAYADMLRNFYGEFGVCTTSIDSMEAAKRQSFLKAGITSTILNESAKFGKQIASAIIKWSEADGSNNAKQYISLSGEGVWTPASHAAAPFWAENRSLVKDVANVYALINPAYSSDTASSFYKMAREVHTVTSNLTPEQKAIALFWDDSPNGKYMTVFGHWTFITANLIDQHRLPLLKAAEAYVKMAIAMHDASILAWKGKYGYNVLRPETYIQQQIDPYWKPLIATPPHPEFPAAHATLSTAAAVALCSSFGERCAVKDNSYTDIGMQERSFASLQEAAMEAGLSRLYGGIHYRYSIEQGAMLGETAAKFVIQGLSFRKN